MGHEFTGVVTEVGSDVKTVKEGDKIVSPFTTTWYASPPSIQTGHESRQDRSWDMNCRLTLNATTQWEMLLLPEWLRLPLRREPALWLPKTVRPEITFT